MKRIPMPHTIERVRQLHADGAELYCWSSGGGDNALRSAQEVGLEDCILAFLPKPQTLIDDVAVTKRRLIELHPNEGATVDTATLRARVQEAQ